MALKLRMTRDNMIEKLYLLIWAFYSVSYFLLYVSRISSLYNVSGLLKLLSYATILMQVGILIAIRYKLKDFIAYAALILLLFLIEIQNSDRSLLIYVLFIILSQQIDFDRFIRFDIKLKTFILALIVGLCAAGMIDNREMMINGSYKQALGFGHPNAFCSYVFTILIEWLCIRYKKMKWYEWIIIAGLSFAAMRIGGGRSSGYTYAAIFLLYILATYFEDLFYTGIVKAAFIAIAPLMAIASFWMVNLYGKGNAVGIALNTIFTGRLRYSYQVLSSYGIKLFGQDLEWGEVGTSSRIILDNAYIRCAVLWGAIFFVLLIAAYCVLFAKLLKNHRVDLALMSLFFVILGLGETYMLHAIYNVTLLCLLSRSEEASSESKTVIRLKKNKGAKRLKHRKIRVKL